MTPKPTLSIEDLKKKALAATPGGWTYDAEYQTLYDSKNGAIADFEGCKNHPANKNFIAACSPDVILNLIAELEFAQGLVGADKWNMQQNFEASQRMLDEAEKRIKGMEEALKEISFRCPEKYGPACAKYALEKFGVK